MPNDIPGKIRLQNGVVCHAMIFLVHTRDAETKMPRLCTMIPNGHRVEQAGGEEYFLGYVPETELVE